MFCGAKVSIFFLWSYITNKHQQSRTSPDYRSGHSMCRVNSRMQTLDESKSWKQQARPPTYWDADVRVRDLVLSQLPLQVRGNPYCPERTLLGQDELRVEHLRLPSLRCWTLEISKTQPLSVLYHKLDGTWRKKDSDIRASTSKEVIFAAENKQPTPKQARVSYQQKRNASLVGMDLLPTRVQGGNPRTAWNWGLGGGIWGLGRRRARNRAVRNWGWIGREKKWGPFGELAVCGLARARSTDSGGKKLAGCSPKTSATRFVILPLLF